MALYVVNASLARLYVQAEGTNPVTGRYVITVSPHPLPHDSLALAECILGHDQQVKIPAYDEEQHIRINALHLDVVEMPNNIHGNRLLVVRGLPN
ncbi:hypothetical protein HY633_04745 [Candidatus Uhrbacteria bacterium]|nr:hypothetical protein [Candidatus Uhrbacteria bacterium]